MSRTDGTAMCRSIIEDAIVDSARGLNFTIEHEGGRRERHWLGVLNHLLKELHKFN